MSFKLGAAVAVIAMFLTEGSAPAHHSFQAVFDSSQEYSLSGTLTTLHWINPHITLSLDVKSGDAMEAWVIEGGPPSFFRRRNISKDQFEKGVGQRVVVQILRARDGSRLGSLLKITFTDGTFITSFPGA